MATAYSKEHVENIVLHAVAMPLSSSRLHALAGWPRSGHCTWHLGMMRRSAGAWAQRRLPASWPKLGCSWRWCLTRGALCWWMGCPPLSATLLWRLWAPLRRCGRSLGLK